ncbi:MAG: 16S rRNA (guanine(527)-N(7))-methyltransferase RsmG [Solirubrobacteraceae bacterium]
MPEHPRDCRIETLAARYQLGQAAVTQLERLLDLLITDPLAPTGIRAPREVIDDHFADALVALELDVVRDAPDLADLGSGAGIPGLPLAIAKPTAEVSLVESNGRKCDFIRQAAQACGLHNVTVIHSRAESWSGGLGGFELVTARALDSLAVVAEYAAPLLAVGGALVAWRGRRDGDAEATAARAMAAVGLEPRQVRRMKPYEGAEQRHLHVSLKVMETPPGFPRRAGIARKRPLGARVKSESSDARGPSDRVRR